MTADQIMDRIAENDREAERRRELNELRDELASTRRLLAISEAEIHRLIYGRPGE